MPPLPPLGRDGIKNDEASLAFGQKEPYFTRPLGRVGAKKLMCRGCLMREKQKDWYDQACSSFF